MFDQFNGNIAHSELESAAAEVKRNNGFPEEIFPSPNQVNMSEFTHILLSHLDPARAILDILPVVLSAEALQNTKFALITHFVLLDPPIR